MDNVCKPRVLFVDNNPEDVNDWVPRLEQAGYQTHGVVGRGEDLIQRTRSSAAELRPHIAVVDLRIQDHPSNDSAREDDMMGLRFKPILDHAEVILYSAYLSVEVDRLASQNKFFSFVEKGDSPQVLLDEIAKGALLKSACLRDFVPELPDGWTAARMTETLFSKVTPPVPENLVIDVLAQLFPDASSVLLTTLDPSVSSPKSPTRGRSIVWQLRPHAGEEPWIIKFAGANDVSDEFHNYRKYIVPYVAGGFYSQLESQKTFWDAGAILYKFMALPEGLLPIFSRFYTEMSDPVVIVRPLKFFFEKVWRNMYSRKTPSTTSLWDAYDRAVFNRHNKDGASLAERLETFPNKDRKISFPKLAGHFENPVAWLRRHREASKLAGGAFEAITHGDLHGDNLFVSENYAWAIDFERSGPGPILRDFAQFEMDLVTRLIPEEIPLTQFYELCITLALPRQPNEELLATPSLQKVPELAKAFQVIRDLRKIASNVTEYQDIAELYWGLLFDAIFIITRQDTEAQHERAQLYAAILCERLSHRDGKWPRDGWDPVQFLPPDAPLSTMQSSSTPRNDFDYSVFLSYNSQDRHLVRWLADALDARGFRVWFDEKELLGGQPWQERLEQGEKESTCCVVCWGGSGLGPWQNEELRAALQRRTERDKYRVIPILLPNSLPPEEMPLFLRNLQYIDFRPGMHDPRGMAALEKAINAVIHPKP